MKNLKDKFKKKIIFVKPLYKKVNPNPNAHTTSEFVTVDIDNKEKLCGNGKAVKKRIGEGKSNIIKVFHKNSTEKFNIIIPSVCEKDIKEEFSVRDLIQKERNAEVNRSQRRDTKMIGIVENTQTRHSNVKFPDTWLRVYPAPVLPNESASSISFRCLMCQMGISTFLLIWTIIWVLVIHYFEGPFEKKVSEDFEHAQNLLVIDLATELRQGFWKTAVQSLKQITPLSPKWRKAIEDRIEAERQLTIAAVGRGARLHPGHFWDVPGTFLFSVYVMTALGFGAPVPQTIWGRTSTLIYAVFAVPAHIYLMVHLSTCVIVNVEYCIRRLRPYRPDRTFNVGRSLDYKTVVHLSTCVVVNVEYCIRCLRLYRRRDHSFNVGRSLYYKTESPNCSRNSELKPNKCKFRKRLLCIVGVFCMGRGVPLAMLLYYILGTMVFGIARSKQPLEVAMFPLEFTTTGGLEHVECFVRLIYGIYVEGAMILVSCALATLRRHSSGSARHMADRYRLFAHERLSDEE